jgi:hypothetical protein
LGDLFTISQQPGLPGFGLVGFHASPDVPAMGFVAQGMFGSPQTDQLLEETLRVDETLIKQYSARSQTIDGRSHSRAGPIGTNQASP